MEIMQKGITRPDLFSQCKNCQIVSNEMILAQSKTGANNVKVTCEQTTKKKGLLKKRETEMVMHTTAPYQDHKETKLFNELVENLSEISSPIFTGQFYTNIEDVTKKCPGLQTVRKS